MKLYTKEQVEKILCTAIYVENPQIQSDKVHIEANKYLKQLTPIELPSDEEIDTASLIISKDRKEFLMGAKYVINKIQGGNNEQQ